MGDKCQEKKEAMVEKETTFFQDGMKYRLPRLELRGPSAARSNERARTLAVNQAARVHSTPPTRPVVAT
jgi:hypothetical protein